MELVKSMPLSYGSAMKRTCHLLLSYLFISSIACATTGCVIDTVPMPEDNKTDANNDDGTRMTPPGIFEPAAEYGGANGDADNDIDQQYPQCGLDTSDFIVGGIGTVDFTTTGAVDQLAPSCDSLTNGGSEVVVLLTSPDDGVVYIHMDEVKTATQIYARQGCELIDDHCEQNVDLALSLAADESIYVIFETPASTDTDGVELWQRAIFTFHAATAAGEDCEFDGQCPQSLMCVSDICQ